MDLPGTRKEWKLLRSYPREQPCSMVLGLRSFSLSLFLSLETANVHCALFWAKASTTFGGFFHGKENLLGNELLGPKAMA